LKPIVRALAIAPSLDISDLPTMLTFRARTTGAQEARRAQKSCVKTLNHNSISIQKLVEKVDCLTAARLKCEKISASFVPFNTGPARIDLVSRIDRIILPETKKLEFNFLSTINNRHNAAWGTAPGIVTDCTIMLGFYIVILFLLKSSVILLNYN
jgi:hypothetical protein